MAHKITSAGIGGSFEEYLAKKLATLGPEARALFERMSAQAGLAVELIELRKSRGMTQAQLAEASGVHQSEISRIESGNANPSKETLDAIGKVFGARIGFVSNDRELTTAR